MYLLYSLIVATNIEHSATQPPASQPARSLRAARRRPCSHTADHSLICRSIMRAGRSPVLSVLLAATFAAILAVVCGEQARYLQHHTCAYTHMLQPPKTFHLSEAGTTGQDCAERCRSTGAGTAVWYAHDAKVRPLSTSMRGAAVYPTARASLRGKVLNWCLRRR